MKAGTSLAKRLRLSLIVIGVLNVIVMLVAVDLAYEDMKAGLLEVELKEERSVLQEVVRRDGSLRAWNTANLTTAFIRDEDTTQVLPPVFQGVEVPYSGEVSHAGDLFLVTTERLQNPGGTLYLAQDISTLRDRERRFQLALLAIALLMLGLTLLFAHLGAAHLVRPLKRLTHQIRHIIPGNFMPRLSTRYQEAEYVDISMTFNRFLEALETHVQREKTMLAMAGHELRTPLTVISGALDVLEQRDTLSHSDRRTSDRIRRATEDMRGDVEVLLALTRTDGQEQTLERLLPGDLIQAVVAELEACHPEQGGRLVIQGEALQQPVDANPALVRMLFRNLLQNALKHTHGEVYITLSAAAVEIRDTGPGLSEEVIQQLTASPMHNSPQVPAMTRGLGLFIVQLVSERLGWPLIVKNAAATGTTIRIQTGKPDI